MVNGEKQNTSPFLLNLFMLTKVILTQYRNILSIALSSFIFLCFFSKKKQKH